MIKPPLSYSNWLTKSSHTWIKFMRVLTCRRKLKKRLRKGFAGSLRSLDILVISTLTTAETLSTERRKHFIIFFTGYCLAYQTYKGKPIQPSFWCPYRSQTSISSMTKCSRSLQSTKIFKLNSKQCIKTLKHWGMRAWILLSFRKKLPNSSKRKSNCLPKSTYLRTRGNVKISKLCWKQHPS